MKYLMPQYIDEAAMLKLPRKEAGRLHGAYTSFVAASGGSRRLTSTRCPPARSSCV